MDGLMCFMSPLPPDFHWKKKTKTQQTSILGLNIPAARNQIQQKEESVTSM